MSKLKELTMDELENLIEQKVLEFFGDPDSGLSVRQEFKEELSGRLKNSYKRISHKEVQKKFA